MHKNNPGVTENVNSGSEWCSYGWGWFVLTFLYFSKLLPAHKPLKLEKKNQFF